MRLAIIGSRSWTNGHLAYVILDAVARNIPVELVVSGGAKGADSIGENWADDRGIPTRIFRPDWDQYGKRAGMMRNTDIIENADTVVAFWDGSSRGTRNSLNKAIGKLRIVIEPTRNRVLNPGEKI